MHARDEISFARRTENLDVGIGKPCRPQARCNSLGGFRVVAGGIGGVDLDEFAEYVSRKRIRIRRKDRQPRQQECYPLHYITPKVAKASAAPIPSSMAFLTRFSVAAFFESLDQNLFLGRARNG